MSTHVYRREGGEKKVGNSVYVECECPLTQIGAQSSDLCNFQKTHLIFKHPVGRVTRFLNSSSLLIWLYLLKKSFIVQYQGAKTGKDNGYTILLDVESFDYKFFKEGSEGLKVALVHHLDMPIMRQTGFHISPGTENQIAITPTLLATTKVRHVYIYEIIC